MVPAKFLNSLIQKCSMTINHLNVWPWRRELEEMMRRPDHICAHTEDTGYSSPFPIRDPHDVTVAGRVR